MKRVYSVLVTVRGEREMSLLLLFFEALRLPSVTSPFSIYNSGPCACCALWIVVWHLFLHLFAEFPTANTNSTKVFDGVVGSFYICRAMDVFSRVCNWLLFVVAETSVTDIQDIIQHFLRLEQRIFLQFLWGIQQASLFTMTALH